MVPELLWLRTSVFPFDLAPMSNRIGRRTIDPKTRCRNSDFYLRVFTYPGEIPNPFNLILLNVRPPQILMIAQQNNSSRVKEV
jgi:hypothetical protein